MTTTTAARRSSLQRWRRVFLDLAVFGTALAIPIAWALATRERPLLAQASAVASTSEWKHAGWPRRGPARHFWLTEREVALERWGRAGLQLVRYDTRTKRQAPLSPLSLLNGGALRGARLSPDGKWLLFWERSRGRGSGMVAAALDGSQRITWPAARWSGGGFAGQAVWAPDSRGWAWVATGRGRPRATIFSLDNPRQERAVSLLGTGAAAAPANRAGHVLGYLSGQGEPRFLLTMQDTGGFFPWTFFGEENYFHFPPAIPAPAARAPGPPGAAAPAAPKPPAVTLLAFDLTNGSLPRPIRVPLPPGTTMGTVTLSPRGDHLAWLLERETESPLVPLVRRFLPKHPWASRPRTRTASLWVSRTDGSDLRRIGAIELEPLPLPSSPSVRGAAGVRYHLYHTHHTLLLYHLRTLSRRDDVPGGLRWTPDGKRLSFVYDGTLWAVPAG